MSLESVLIACHRMFSGSYSPGISGATILEYDMFLEYLHGATILEDDTFLEYMYGVTILEDDTFLEYPNTTFHLNI